MERPSEADREMARIGEQRRRYIWAGLVCLIFFSIAVAIIV